MKKPLKFTGTKTPKSDDDVKRFSFNPWAVACTLIIIGIVTATTIHAGNIYNDWKANWDVVSFAKNNPEIVRTVKKQYDAGLAELKQEIVSPKE